MLADARVRIESKVINLKPKEYELLFHLAKHKNQVLSRDQILEKVCGGGIMLVIAAQWMFM